MNGAVHGHNLLSSHTYALRSAPPSLPPTLDYEWGLTSFAAVLFIASRKRRNNDVDPHHASSFYHPRREAHPSRGGSLIWFISKIRLPNRRTDPRSHVHRADHKLTALTNSRVDDERAFTRYEIRVRRRYEADMRLATRTLVFFRTSAFCMSAEWSRDVFSAIQSVPEFWFFFF